MRSNVKVGRGVIVSRNVTVAPKATVHSKPKVLLTLDQIIARRKANEAAQSATAARYRASLIAKGLIVTKTIPTDREFAENYARNYVAA